MSILKRDNNPESYIFKEGGMLNDIGTIMITDMIYPFVFLIIDIWIFLKYMKRCKIWCGKSNITQFQANKHYEGTNFNIAYKYAYVLKTVYLSAWYAYIFPMGLILGLGALFVNYWCIKYLLLRRNTRPQ
jgi:hypothetical protein